MQTTVTGMQGLIIAGINTKKQLTNGCSVVTLGKSGFKGQHVNQLLPSNRDYRQGMETKASRHVLVRPGYWLLTCLLAIFTILILGFDPQQAEATRHIPLE
jgi:hypothetical protein